ncbi:MAG: histidine phosphatase family protein [Zoogloeaceae bacterium]|nr:histidine phosphatase family protein [Zoogloeaceae bacterium]
MTRICIVRHGETDWNVARRLQGHLDVPLNATGQAQAQTTAAHLAEETFTALYSSDLLRARQTAEALASAVGLPVTPEPRLRERRYGAFEGLTYDEARAQYPQDYARFEDRDPDLAFPGGGERLVDFAQRIETALLALADRHRGESILLVTHGGVLDIVYRLATGKPLEAKRDFPIPNAALNWLGRMDGGWQLIAWAGQAHLAASRDELPNA